MPNLAYMIAPLYRLLYASTSGQWTSQEQNAFEPSKELLAARRVLAHYDPQLPLVLASDASPWVLCWLIATLMALRNQWLMHHILFQRQRRITLSD